MSKAASTSELDQLIKILRDNQAESERFNAVSLKSYQGDLLLLAKAIQSELQGLRDRVEKLVQQG